VRVWEKGHYFGRVVQVIFLNKINTEKFDRLGHEHLHLKCYNEQTGGLNLNIYNGSRNKELNDIDARNIRMPL